MTNMLPGEAPHHGMYDNVPYRISQDKPDDGGRWYFSRKEIEDDSPSRLDSIDMKKETYLRKSYCTFLQDLGMRLKVPQVTIATAIIFCHRFFHRQSHAKNDRRIIATVCMFLAGKVEETPRPLKDVILVSYEIIHKKDPSAVQRIKQKEVYEQQKELILVGERAVLATLGFDLNVHHPYKPLVEAIKKFKVAQNALAQVAWNFVNDGLRTSLCLQFMPHHIAAGAIFLAAKFLKVKLPSDGEKVWWQEFDVTPRQLEEVSNQMLELYEQNRVPQPSQTSEVEGSGDAAVGRHPSSKVPAGNEEHSMAQSGVTNSKPGTLKPAPTPQTDNHGGHSKVPAGNEKHSMSQSGVTISKPGTLKPVPTPDRSHTDNHGGHSKTTQKRSNDYVEMKSDQKAADGEVHKSVEPQYQEEVQNRPGGEDQERNKCHSYREGGAICESPQEAIKKIDKDKVKAALEKRRKARGDTNRKTDLMDEDDIIERELEDGIQLDADTDKLKQERANWSKTLKFPDHEKGQQHSRGQEEYVNVEEGEVATLGHGYCSPKSSNRKRKAGSPPGRPMDRTDYVHVSNHHNPHDIPDDRNRFARLGYMETDKKRRVQENRV